MATQLEKPSVSSTGELHGGDPTDVFDIDEETIQKIIPSHRILGWELEARCELKNVPLEAVFWEMNRRGWTAGETESGEDEYLPPEGAAV